MARVIESTVIPAAEFRLHAPRAERYGHDLVEAIVELEPGADVTGLEGREAVVVRPDGTRISCVIEAVEVIHRVPALLLTSVCLGDVPAGSEITWAPAGAAAADAERAAATAT